MLETKQKPLSQTKALCGPVEGWWSAAHDPDFKEALKPQAFEALLPAYHFFLLPLTSPAYSS